MRPTFNILYEDEQILAVNKPAGISVIHDSQRLNTPNMVNLLESDFGKLWVVHRLDRETSGVLIFARTGSAHKGLNKQFQAREVKKEYQLLAYGDFSWQQITINLPLFVNGDRKHRTVVDQLGGKPAKTDFEKIEFFDHSINLIKAAPFSGYTHQIRAHLSALNGSILCDPLYQPHPYPLTSAIMFDPTPFESWISANLPIRRLALHASKIDFTHPADGNQRTILAPFPEDFDQSIKILKSKGQA